MIVFKENDLADYYNKDMPIQFLLSIYRRYAWDMLKTEWEGPSYKDCAVKPLGVVLDKYPTSDRIDALVFWSDGDVSTKIFAVGKEGAELHECQTFGRLTLYGWIIDIILDKAGVYKRQ